MGPPGAGKSKISKQIASTIEYYMLRQFFEEKNVPRDVADIIIDDCYKIITDGEKEKFIEYMKQNKVHLGDEVQESLVDLIKKKKLKFCQISTGQELRRRKEQDELPEEDVKRILRGDLVRNDTMYNVLEKLLRYDAKFENFLLDGFPRTPKQARYLWKKLEDYDREVRKISVKRPIDDIIQLEVDKQTAKKRITGRRECPNPECNASAYNMNYEDFRPKKTFESTKGIYMTGACKECDTELILRPDDTIKVFEKRWKQYEEGVKPAVRVLLQKMNIIDLSGKIPLELVVPDFFYRGKGIGTSQILR